MSTSASGAPRQYTRRNQKSRDDGVNTAKKGKRTLTPEEQSDLVIRGLREEVARANALVEKQQSEFDRMFRRSEAMRNRQVDIINRLSEGRKMDDIVSDLLMENAAIRVELEFVQQQLDMRSRQLDSALNKPEVAIPATTTKEETQ